MDKPTDLTDMCLKYVKNQSTSMLIYEWVGLLEVLNDITFKIVEVTITGDSGKYDPYISITTKAQMGGESRDYKTSLFKLDDGQWVIFEQGSNRPYSDNKWDGKIDAIDINEIMKLISSRWKTIAKRYSDKDSLWWNSLEP